MDKNDLLRTLCYNMRMRKRAGYSDFAPLDIRNVQAFKDEIRNDPDIRGAVAAAKNKMLDFIAASPRKAETAVRMAMGNPSGHIEESGLGNSLSDQLGNLNGLTEYGVRNGGKYPLPLSMAKKWKALKEQAAARQAWKASWRGRLSGILDRMKGTLSQA